MYHKRRCTGFERLAKSRFNVLPHSASGLIVAIPLIEDRRSQKLKHIMAGGGVLAWR